MRQQTLVDVNTSAGAPTTDAQGLSCSLAGEGQYKIVLPDTTEVLISISSTVVRFMPIPKGSTVKNTDNSAVAADNVWFVYWG
jgi:hypothetical protein